MKISLPLTQVLQASTLRSRAAHKRDLQQVLQELDGGILSNHPTKIIGGTANIFHGVSFTLGNPPQKFNAFVDLGAQDLVIPSGRQPGSPGDSELHFYNSTLSTSFRANGTTSSSYFFDRNVTGFLSGDELRIGDVHIGTQMFQETENMPEGIDCMICDLVFDTAFPLGFYNRSAERNYMSPIAQLVENGLLDENKFSLRLSRNPTDDNGQLLFGGVLDRDTYFDDFVTIPLTPLPIPVVPDINMEYIAGDKWKVEASSLSLGTLPQHTYKFPDHTVAIIDTFYPFFLLSETIANAIHKFLQASTWGPLAWVDCRKRQIWPNITITLAGEKFEMTPYDYTLEQVYDDEPDELYCMSAFMGGFRDEDNLIFIGSAFVKTWVSVWDLDGGGVSFARAKHGPPRVCIDSVESSLEHCRHK